MREIANQTFTCASFLFARGRRRAQSPLLTESQSWSERTIRYAVSEFPRDLSNGTFAHAHGSVDHTAFQHDNGFRVDVALNARCPLYFDSLVGDNRADHRAADDDFVGTDIT